MPAEKSGLQPVVAQCRKCHAMRTDPYEPCPGCGANPEHGWSLGIDVDAGVTRTQFGDLWTKLGIAFYERSLEDSRGERPYLITITMTRRKG